MWGLVYYKEEGKAIGLFTPNQFRRLVFLGVIATRTWKHWSDAGYDVEDLNDMVVRRLEIA